MHDKYTAKMYLGKEKIMQNSGNDIDALFIWIVTKSSESSGNIHGKIIDNATHKVIRKFQKTPADE